MYCTRQKSAFFYNRGRLLEDPKHFLWGNPPFSQLARVVTKAAIEPTKLILVTPDWGDVYWRRVLEKLSVAQVQIESGSALYKSDLNECNECQTTSISSLEHISDCD